MSPALAAGFLSTGPPGESDASILKTNVCFWCADFSFFSFWFCTKLSLSSKMLVWKRGTG